MATIPPSRPAQIEFCTSHVPVWEEHEAAIGLPDGFAGELNALTQAARDAAQAAYAARQASEAATQIYHDAVAAMRAKAAKGVRTIRMHADTTEDAGVLALAQIDPEKSPSATPLPTTPLNPRCDVESEGAIRVSWESTGTYGGYFDIFRRLANASGDGVGTLVRIGSCGTKHFIDTNVPLGTFMATYYVRACRGKRTGPMSAAASIQFGSVMGVMAPSSPMGIKRAA